MRVLLDECLPRKLKAMIVGHDVKTVADCGWSGRKNGELLTLAQEHFDVFITVDRNLSFQQNVSIIRIGIIVLEVPSNAIEHLEPLVPKVLQSLSALRSGQILRVST